MDLNTFSFFTQQIPYQEFDWQMMCDFALKCYNLFLLFFYFNVAKFIIRTLQYTVRRLSRFSR